MKINRQNNYAFIDSQNLYLGVKSQGWKIDYDRFFVYLKDKYLVEYLDKKHKLLKLMIPNKHGFSRLLRKFRQYVVYIQDLREKISLKKNKKREGVTFGRTLGVPSHRDKTIIVNNHKKSR